MRNKFLGLSAMAAILLLAGSPAFATSQDAGPEPYSAPTPHYTPMTKEPVFKAPPAGVVSLGSAADIKGPAAGPEPYSAPDPNDKM